MRRIRTYHPDSSQSRLFIQALVITLTGNILLACLKGFAAYWSNSSAIYADAINSFSDVFYSILLVIGLWLSQRPPDLSHPQGHSRFEPFTALIITVSMAIAGFEAGRSSVVRFFEGGGTLLLGIPLIILLVSIGIKALMYILIKKAAVQAASPGLEAAAKDNISDVATSIAALIGVLAATFIHPLFDPIAGLFVAIWIFKAVVEMALENLGYLTGAGVDQKLQKKYIDCVNGIDGIEDVHHIITAYAGPKLVVDMHVNVDGNMTLNQAHEICDNATELLSRFTEVDRAYVHIEPIGHK